MKSTLAFLSTYPPRECGIATFTQDLLASTQKFLGPLIDCKVAALNLSHLDTYNYPSEVAWEVDQHSESDLFTLANSFTEDDSITGVIIQHEYGIFGGDEGEYLLTFMQHCHKPMLVTLHTALPHPSHHMKAITNEIINLAHTVVVLTETSKQIIEQVYPSAKGKVFVIPHGIHPTTFSHPKKHKAKLELDQQIVLTTFGLLSRGKGLEYTLRALPEVITRFPSVTYLILGETHPIIRRNEGEAYRLELAQLVAELGLENHVKFYDQYFELSELLTYLKATDVYIATSIDPNQAVSGTLSYALGTGVAVISTEFSQAKEIVTADTGRLVPIMDSPALTEALIDLLSDEKRLEQMHQNAYEMTRPMLWSNVAEQYVRLLPHVLLLPMKLSHLKAMTDDFGMFQFAKFSIPDKAFGYTLDDNARALIVCSWLVKDKLTKELEELLRIYLLFIQSCQHTDGSFTNYLTFEDKSPTSQNMSEDLQDAHARALWGLSETIANRAVPENLRTQAKILFLHALKRKSTFTHLRAKAFAIKAFALVIPLLHEKKNELMDSMHDYAQSLIDALSENSINTWRWFEKDLNYNNALLPESLLIAGAFLNNETYTKEGLASLDFLISKTFSTTYMPIGHAQWYKNNEKRSEYDQQPEDPASMILALVTAYTLTHDEKYKQYAFTCFSWFIGNNSLKKPLYDIKTGGCYDGLHPDRVNLNQGAESLVSYLMSRVMIMQLLK